MSLDPWWTWFIASGCLWLLTLLPPSQKTNGLARATFMAGASLTGAIGVARLLMFAWSGEP
jgi:hypothetical protein